VSSCAWTGKDCTMAKSDHRRPDQTCHGELVVRSQHLVSCLKNRRSTYGPGLKRIQLLDVIIWPLSHLPRPPSALGSLSSPTASQCGQYPSPSASWRDASSVLDPLLGELIFRIASRLMRSCLLPIERSRVVDSVRVVSLRFIHRSRPLGSSRCTR